MDTPLCLSIVGTRPEAIKMAPVVRCIEACARLRSYVIEIGQHETLLSNALEGFGIVPDERLTISRKRNSILEVVAQAIDFLDEAFARLQPAYVIAQGDTATVAAGAVAAFYRRIPFVHVEAGLRSNDLSAPFPEEFNRRIAALGATLHCAPTEEAARNLIAEGVDPEDCLVTGNTVIDGLLATHRSAPPLPPDFPDVRRPILVTAHRRESFGERMETAFRALREVVDTYPDVALYFPVHPNPNTRTLANRILGGHERIVRTEPLGYAQMVAALAACWLVVTDSGGLQEEAPALGKPVLVLRDVTERPEAVAMGAVRLVGTNADAIRTAISELHDQPSAYEAMARPIFPYGDGHAAERIVAAMLDRLPEDRRS